MYKKHDDGFTIVELLVVIVVIAILAAITIVAYTGVTNRANIASIQSDLTNASQQLKMYYTEHGFYPTSIDANTKCLKDSSGIPDTNYCLKTSYGNTFSYVFSSANHQTFCVVETNGAQSYTISQDSAPSSGNCLNYGLVLNLDAGNSASYPGTGTNWYDLSGNGNNSTLSSTGVTYNSANGGALSFDGNSGYVSSPSVPFLSLIGNAYTLSIWVKDDTTAITLTGTYHRIINFANGSIGIQLGLGADVLGTGRIFYIQEGSATNVRQVTLGNASVGWHYVVATSNGSGVWHMYLDGSLSDGGTSMNSGSDPYIINTGYIYIGQRGDGLGRINGFSSNVRIYNRALGSDDILQNFNALRGRYGI
jgi:prepilin-type N-terminal cleavage/methylation domain-containing protein